MSDSSDTARPERSLFYFLAALVFCLHAFVFFDFTTDDSFISYRYVENFVAGEGLVYNEGERVEGYSNFAWVMLLSAWRVCGLDVVFGSKILGLLSLLGIYVLSLRLLNKQLGGPSVFSFGLLYLLICNWSLTFYATSGMETIFYSFLILCSAWFFVKKEMRLSLPGILCLLLVALTRPEGILYFMGFVAFDFLSHRKICKKRVGLALLFSVGYGGFLLWRHWYYGMWVPHTFMPKAPSGLGKMLLGGVNELVKFVQSTGGAIGVVLVLSSLVFKAHRKAALFIVYVFGIGLFFLKYAGDDWMSGYRFLLPVLPFYLIALILGLKTVADRVVESDRKGGLVLLSVFFLMGSFQLNESYKFIRDKTLYPNFVMTSEDLVGPAKWIGENYPKHHTLAILRMGAAAYYSELKIMDLFGLTDPYIGRMKYEQKFNNKVLHEYIGAKKPELIMWDEKLEIGGKLDFNGMGYRAIKQFPQGSVQWWTLCEKGE